ncbi:hypothetical protein PCE1_003772 [Barthelona sp. PCE]
MKIFLLFIGILALATCYTIEFEGWMKKFNVSYSSQSELQERFEIFKERVDLIEEIRKTQKHAEFELNRFADKRPGEMYPRSQIYHPEFSKGKPPSNNRVDGSFADADYDIGVRFTASTDNLPDSFTWRGTDELPPVRNQGACGCCWAFAATSAISASYAINHDARFDASPQWGVDCSGTGCNGNYLHAYALGGVYLDRRLPTLSEYPYTGSVGRCRKDFEGKIRVDSYGYLQRSFTAYDIPQLKAVLREKGPILGAICADSVVELYSSGIITLDQTCSTDLFSCTTGHAIVIVGYEPMPDGDGIALDIQNSWGSGWGDDGFFKLQIRDDNSPGACGIGSYVSVVEAKEESESDVPAGSTDYTTSVDDSGDSSSIAANVNYNAIKESLGDIGDSAALNINLFTGFFAQNPNLTYGIIGGLYFIWFMYFCCWRCCCKGRKNKKKVHQGTLTDDEKRAMIAAQQMQRMRAQQMHAQQMVVPQPQVMHTMPQQQPYGYGQVASQPQPGYGGGMSSFYN